VQKEAPTASPPGLHTAPVSSLSVDSSLTLTTSIPARDLTRSFVIYMSSLHMKGYKSVFILWLLKQIATSWSETHSPLRDLKAGILGSICSLTCVAPSPCIPWLVASSNSKASNEQVGPSHVKLRPSPPLPPSSPTNQNLVTMTLSPPP
jgi:hypothetical protein